MVAKYGDKSVYFDLEDIGNTTGQWDLYGSDAPSPYNSLQVRFISVYASSALKMKHGKLIYNCTYLYVYWISHKWFRLVCYLHFRHYHITHPQKNKMKKIKKNFRHWIYIRVQG